MFNLRPSDFIPQMAVDLMHLKKKTGKSMINSNYLLTNLYRTEYFSHIKQAVIVAYLIPFMDGNNCPYEDSPEGLARKRDDIEQNRLGVARNYASQGFAFGMLYRPHITFPYYYAQLKKLDTYIKAQHLENAQADSNGEFSGIESEHLRGELRDILSKPSLFFKKNHEVFQEDKDILQNHLSIRGNRFVLAELLYYITAQNHQLPAVSEQYFDSIQDDISTQLLTTSAVFMQRRSGFDESASEMRDKLAQAKSFQLLCLNGSAFLDANSATGPDSFFPILLERLRQDPSMTVEFVLGEPDSAANNEAAVYKDAPRHVYIAKNQLSQNSIAGIRKLREYSNAPVYAKTTRLHLPYSINIFRFFVSRLDYLKVDLYSPYISSNGRRPSIIIFRMAEPDLFEHFEMVFNRIWNDEENSAFI